MKIELDVHTHTLASGHAFSTFKENLDEAVSKGLSALGMSDHAPAMPGSAQAIYFTNFKCFRPEVMGVRIYTGVEANIMDFKGNLDLDEAVTTAFVLAMDTKNLCSEDCKGLCPKCGADLNLGPCGCRPEADPRWAALAQLLKEEK